ncbi:glutamate--tRNA ligase [Candidatus Gracilibacteria bacterium]|nr:glutamate--tRNA ligase [Candidatus Gracilibacteria bacterium]
MIVRTRLAPSPTGYLHIGNLRTALYAYLWARHNEGQFIVRIEDTDRTRLIEDAVDKIINTLTIVGMRPDEGPHHDGGYGPYIQSERLYIYAPRLHQLCDDGTAYYCFCTSDRLTSLRTEQEELKLPPRYDGYCRHLPIEESKIKIAEGEKYTIRLKVPKNEILVFNDTIRGRIEFNTNEVEDQVLLKSDGYPTYHGAIVIDDHLMAITHVMRGEEWISSIPKQVLVARALNITLPEYAHLPNVLGADGKKLSKRMGDVSVSEYLKKGYLTEALLNFLSLLGWHSGNDNEIMTMDEMIEQFEIKDIHKSGAVLDPIKLDWMNGEYIKRMEIGELHARVAKYLEEYEPDFYSHIFSPRDYNYNTRIITELQTRMKRFEEFIPLTSCLYGDAGVRTDLMVNVKMKIETVEQGIEALRFVLPLLISADYTTLDTLKVNILGAIASSGLKNGQILWPLRVALSGEEFSPGAFELAYILGRDESVKRIQRIIA